MGTTRYDGAGTTLTNSTETWDTAIRVKSLGGMKRTREVFDDTPLSEVADAEKVFATIVEYGSIEIEYYADPDSPAPFTAIPNTWVVTFPAKTGQTNGATITFTGAIIEDDSGGRAHGSRSMSKAVLMPDGKTGPTFAAGS